MSPIPLNFYSEHLTNDIFEGFGDLKIRGHVIRTVKYADELNLLAKEEPVLRGMVDRLIKTGKCCGMEMNAEKN